MANDALLNRLTVPGYVPPGAVPNAIPAGAQSQVYLQELATEFALGNGFNIVNILLPQIHIPETAVLVYAGGSASFTTGFPVSRILVNVSGSNTTDVASFWFFPATTVNTSIPFVPDPNSPQLTLNAGSYQILFGAGVPMCFAAFGSNGNAADVTVVITYSAFSG